MHPRSIVASAYDVPSPTFPTVVSAIVTTGKRLRSESGGLVEIEHSGLTNAALKLFDEKDLEKIILKHAEAVGVAAEEARSLIKTLSNHRASTAATGITRQEALISLFWIPDVWYEDSHNRVRIAMYLVGLIDYKCASCNQVTHPQRTRDFLAHLRKAHPGLIKNTEGGEATLINNAIEAASSLQPVSMKEAIQRNMRQLNDRSLSRLVSLASTSAVASLPAQVKLGSKRERVRGPQIVVDLCKRVEEIFVEVTKDTEPELVKALEWARIAAKCLRLPGPQKDAETHLGLRKHISQLLKRAQQFCHSQGEAEKLKSLRGVEAKKKKNREALDKHLSSSLDTPSARLLLEAPEYFV